MSTQTSTLRIPLVPAGLLSNRWVLAACITWHVLAACTLYLLSLAAPQMARTAQLVCTEAECARQLGRLTPVKLQNLQELGLTPAFYAAYYTTLHVVFALLFLLVAAVVLWRGSNIRMAIVGAFMLLLFGAADFLDLASRVAVTYPSWFLPAATLEYVGSILFITYFFVFPDGRFVLPWTRWIVVPWALLSLSTFLPDPPEVLLSPLVALPLFFITLGSLVYAQIYRYRRVSNEEQRQQTKWVVYGFAVAITAFLIYILLGAVLPLSVTEHPVLDMVAITICLGIFLIIPITIGMSVVKTRLWDIDPIINRTLVYGILSVVVVGLYVSVVFGLGTLFQAQGNPLLSLFATGLVAVLFQPLRYQLQQNVNRLLYGERDEPYQVLSRLGQRLEGSIVPLTALPSIVETVQEALKLPYVAIVIFQGDELINAAEMGVPTDDQVRFPLSYQGQPIGELQVAPRSKGEAFSRSDARLLEDIARHAGAAVHAVQLTKDLQRSRERLVTAREEERRRLRRDLHDGLGPRLAGQTLKLEAAHDLTDANPAQAKALLNDLVQDSQELITEIRRLVYALRPPALDELGLLPSLREQVAQCRHGGLRIVVDAPEDLPPLPAAVEVAVFRVVQEALTNVMRHAKASTCHVGIEVPAGELVLEVRDDGVGLTLHHRSGIGLQAMRERAEELGGRFALEQLPAGGTRVLVHLPVAGEA